MTGLAPLNDVVSTTLERAMDGIQARERVTAANIANAATPNYRARQVTFEASLAAAAQAGQPNSAVIAETNADTPVKLDGNSVDLQHEFHTMQKDGLAYQSVINAFNFKMNVIRAALAR